MEKEKPSTALRDSKNQTSEQIRKEELVSTENNKNKQQKKKEKRNWFRLKTTKLFFLNVLRKVKKEVLLLILEKSQTWSYLIKSKKDVLHCFYHFVGVLLKKQQQEFLLKPNLT